MRWRVAELREFLLADPDVRILFVEGLTDLTLWRHLMPVDRRGDVTIYSIGSVDVQVGAGGNKERVVELARLCDGWAEADRMLFFVDSDCDRFLDVEYPPRVRVTDGRDRESYTLLDNFMACLCEIGAGEQPVATQTLRAIITDILRPIGILRILSATENLQLPFKATFRESDVTRFFRRRRGEYTLQRENMIDALLDEAERPRAEKAGILQALAEAERTYAELHDWQIVHGKDLTAFLAWFFDIPFKIASGLIALSLAANVEEVATHANIGDVMRWMREAA